MIPDRIMDKIAMCPMSGCWLWTGADSGDGYGKVWFHGRSRYVHRVVYEQTVDSLAPGIVLDHLCRVRACCNPIHLEPVTVLVNTLRGDAVLFTGSTL